MLKNIKSSLVTVALATSLLFAATSYAANNLNIVVAETIKVVKESAIFKQEQEAMEKVLKPQETSLLNTKKTLDTLEKSLQSKIASYQKEAAKLSVTAKQTREKALQKEIDELHAKQQAYVKNVEQFQALVQQKQQEVQQKVQKALEEAIKKFAESKKYDLVLDNALVPYYSDKLNVTKELAAYLDAETKKTAKTTKK